MATATFAITVDTLEVEHVIEVAEGETAGEICRRVIEGLELRGARSEDARLKVDGVVVGNEEKMQGGFEGLQVVLDFARKEAVGELEGGGVEVAEESLRKAAKEADVRTTRLLLVAGVGAYRELLNDFVQAKGCDAGRLEQLLEVITSSTGHYLAAWYHDKARRTPLHECDLGCIEVLATQFKIPLDQRDTNGHAPIADATQSGDLPRVEALLKVGARIDVGDSNARTPLMLSAWWGFEGIVEVLINGGAAIDHKDNLGATALHRAAQHGHEAVVGHLLRGGAMKNSMDKEGFTPLHRAAAGAHSKVVGDLIAAGANVNIRNNDDRHPYQTAQRATPPAKYAETMAVLQRALPPPPMKRRVIDCLLCCDVGHASRKRLTGNVYLPPNPKR